MRATDWASAVPAQWTRSAACGLTFAAAGEADLPFLARVYASTRADELAQVAWSDADKAAFCEMQFRAQQAHYAGHYPGMQQLVVLRGGQPIGRLYLDRWPREHRLVDIALLPGHRRQGFGGALLRDLMDEAAAAGKALSIHVEKFNPAMHLYDRLGFRKAGEYGIYDLMRREPEPRENPCV
jgi:ribosomal protein S18 acetylase RimI-like enzyme